MTDHFGLQEHLPDSVEKNALLSFSRFYLVVAGLNLLLSQNLFADATEWDYSCNSAIFPSVISFCSIYGFLITSVLFSPTTIRSFFFWESSIIVSCYHSEINAPVGAFDLHLIPGRIKSMWEAFKMTQMWVGILKALQSKAGWARTKKTWNNCTCEIAKGVSNAAGACSERFMWLFLGIQ